MADVTDMYRLAADLAVASVTSQLKGGNVIAKVAGDIEATAKQLVPVDTGATKNSIGVDMDLTAGNVLTADIGPTTEYAPHLEYGTVQRGPDPFMGPAMDMSTPAFVAAVAALGGDIL